MDKRKVLPLRNWLVCIVLLISLCTASVSFAKVLGTAKPESVGLSSERLKRIDAVLKADVEKGVIPGAVLLIARKGKIAYFKSFGIRNKEKGLPMGKDSIFRIYSMTKSITAVAVAMLLEEGKLVLTDPVSKYIPSFRDIKVAEITKDKTGNEVVTMVEPRNEMTIEDLVTHTSGLSYFFQPYPKAVQQAYLKAGMQNIAQLAQLTIAEFCDKLATLPLAFEPGTQYLYGQSYDVLARVIEVASGMPLDTFFKERIFKPLKMVDTGYRVTGKDMDRLVYLNPQWPLYADPTNLATKFFGGGSGLVSTAMDYARFAQMLLNGGDLDGVRLLGPRTVALMTTDHLGARGNRDDAQYVSVPGRGYGVGFDVYVRVEAGRAYTLGNVGDFFKDGAAGTIYWVDPKEDLMAVFMVSSPGNRLYYRFLIKDLIYQAIMN
ncbi:MAG: beta-lactamase family protein [Desulfobacterales bacterium]|nr:beta-lactamase family protein [Desulfobacterales bacterium]